MNAFVAYHGVDSAVHQQHVEALSRTGYRPVALGVYGDPSNARYNAVWLQRPGADWWAVHNLSSANYQTKFDELTGNGFAPSIVSATGTAQSAIFAAVFEKGTVPWFARHNLRWGPASDPGTLVHENERAFDQGFIPRCLVIYGTPVDRRYAGVWVQNTDATMWSWWQTDALAYQRYFDALKEGGQRPAYLSVGADGTILSVFRCDRIGPWTARHRISSVEYQHEFDQQKALGRRPIVVQAGALELPALLTPVETEFAQFAAVFAEDDTPTARVWTVTGPTTAGSAALDSAVHRFMTAHGIRAGSVAVARNGAVVAARAYTWAEPDYPPTTPATRFRIASVTKLFTAAAISRLVDRGRLTWSTKAFPFIGVTSSLPVGAPVDPAMDAITIEQLVLRTSRLPRDFDASQREIATRIGASTAPIPRNQLLQYLRGLPLVGSIPDGGLYSNTAFYLLTSVIEKASGLAYTDEIHRDVLSPLGIGDVTVGDTAAGARQPGEVPGYDHADIHPSELDFAPFAMAGNAYGGAFVIENSAGAGGLVTSASTIARLLAHYPVWNAAHNKLYGREIGTRYGTLDGTASGAQSRPDGLDVAFMFNKGVSEGEHDVIRDSIDAFLDHFGPGL